MHERKALTLAKALLTIGLTALAVSASAAFPERPIRIVVPFVAGGSTDVAARIMGEALGIQLGGTVIIDNRAGAGGMIGAAAVARAAPDGYTLMMTSNSVASAPNLKEVTSDFRKDFTPISRTVASQFTLLVNPAKLPVNNLRDLLAYMRANPGKLDFASPGAMSSAHFALEDFKRVAGVKFSIIHYSGNSPANAAMMAGEPPAGIDGALSAKAGIDSGRLKALATTGNRRASALPNVPTAAEAGLPGFEAGFSVVLLGPAGIPAPVVNQIFQALDKVLKDPAVIKRLDALGYEVVGSSPQEYAASLEPEIRSSAALIEFIRASEAMK